MCYMCHLRSEATPPECAAAIGAAVGGLSRALGTERASGLLYAAADQVATSDPKTVEYWRAKSDAIKAEQKAKAPPVPAPLAWYWRLWLVLVGNPAWVFWAGFFAGWWYGGFLS